MLLGPQNFSCQCCDSYFSVSAIIQYFIQLHSCPKQAIFVLKNNESSYFTLIIYPYSSVSISPWIGQRPLQTMWLCCYFFSSKGISYVVPTLICHLIAYVYSRKRLLIWSVPNFSSPPNLVYVVQFTLFWLSFSWVNAETSIPRVSWWRRLIRWSLVCLFKSQPPGYRKTFK